MSTSERLHPLDPPPAWDIRRPEQLQILMLFFTLVLFCAISGCSTTPAKESSDTLTIPSVQQIKVGGEGTIILGEFTQPGISLNTKFYATEKILNQSISPNSSSPSSSHFL